MAEMTFTTPGSPAVGAVIQGKTTAVSMSYHGDGKRLYVASEEQPRLQIIDCQNGKAENVPLRFERGQIHLVQATYVTTTFCASSSSSLYRLTTPHAPLAHLCSSLFYTHRHHEKCVLLAGKGSPTQPAGQRYAVSYLSIHDNKILRKFKGHSDVVTHISMCPADDTFLTSSKDGSCRLWDAKAAGCLAKLKLPESAVGEPLAVFDSTGLVFAVTAAMAEGQGHFINLYDARNYDGGGFAELVVSQEDLEKAIQGQVSVSPTRAAELSRAAWKSFAFNLSGTQILIGAEMGLTILLDGFEGTIQRVLVPPGTNYTRPAVTCFTPDDKTVLAGHDDGSISCWDVETGALVNTLKGHAGRVNCLAPNPKYAQIASSCTHTALWVWP